MPRTIRRCRLTARQDEGDRAAIRRARATDSHTQDEGDRKTSMKDEGDRKTSMKGEGDRKTSMKGEGDRKTSMKGEGDRKGLHPTPLRPRPYKEGGGAARAGIRRARATGRAYAGRGRPTAIRRMRGTARRA
jgi:hypothetical protein